MQWNPMQLVASPRFPAMSHGLQACDMPPRCITHVTVGTLLHVARQPRLPADQERSGFRYAYPAIDPRFVVRMGATRERDMRR
jgi:hypothetical protein